MPLEKWEICGFDKRSIGVQPIVVKEKMTLHIVQAGLWVYRDVRVGLWGAEWGSQKRLRGGFPIANTLKPMLNSFLWSRMLRPSKTDAGLTMEARIHS